MVIVGLTTFILPSERNRVFLLPIQMCETYCTLSISKRDVLNSNTIRAPYDELANKVKNFVKEENSRVFILAQGDSGYIYWVLSYDLWPLESNQSYWWNVVTTPDPNNSNAFVIEADDFQQYLLDNYDYFLIYQFDEQFLKSYSGIFENPDEITVKSLYKIQKETGMLELVK